VIDLIEQSRGELEDLCHKHHVKKLELFGSAADGTWDGARSDLDFLVEFLPDYDLGPWLTKYFELKEELEVLFQRSVDLVMASAPRNPYFLREVNRTRTTLYAA
jgi:predicted nucleotidyltransferase